MYALAHPGRCDALLYISGTGLGTAWNAAYHLEADRRRGPIATRLAQLEARHRDPEEEHEYRRLTWSADFADRSRAGALAAQMDRPFAINYEANRALSAETKTWSEPGLVELCRSLDIPALIIHGVSDPRPAWAVESLSEALPRAQTVLLPDIGHVPWLEGKGEFVVEVRRFLASSEIRRPFGA
jgi:proline iminopeptidase